VKYCYHSIQFITLTRYSRWSRTDGRGTVESYFGMPQWSEHQSVSILVEPSFHTRGHGLPIMSATQGEVACGTHQFLKCRPEKEALAVAVLATRSMREQRSCCMRR
jgi:hypothetical protein